MDILESENVQAEAKQRMAALMDHVRHELSGVRTGRATVTILDGVRVTAYGSQLPLNQIATLSVPKPTLIVAQPFDPSLMTPIEKAIIGANLGLNPNNDGRVVRIPIPPLTDERRNELVKLVHKLAEDGRNSVRQIRREINDKLKTLVKDHGLSQNDERRNKSGIQKITDQYIKQIDDLQRAKDTELLTP